MDNGYRAITKDEELIPLDQFRTLGNSEWREIVHNFFKAEGYEYRRPIAQDHYATPTKPVADKLSQMADLIMSELGCDQVGYSQCMAAASRVLSSTSNAPDEWPSETGIPVTGEWVDGFPPLKTDFEASLKNGDTWFSVKAKAFSDDYVVFETSGTEWAALKSDYEFRPIETPAQAEEREREEAKNQLAGLLQKHDQDVTDLCNRSISYFMPLAEFLLDNGYQLKDKSDGELVYEFVLVHPDTKERKTVEITKAMVRNCMEDSIYDELRCDCQPIGETNVVECNCDEYLNEFEIVSGD